MRLKQCAVSAGLDLTNVSGMVVANGIWDGYHLQNSGRIRLDQAKVLEMTITDIDGPYTMSEDELVLGCRVRNTLGRQAIHDTDEFLDRGNALVQRGSLDWQ